MKKQYFGDNKDLFKFDLLEFIYKECNCHTLHYIPMLTDDDTKNHGMDRKPNDWNYGFKNDKLRLFLEKYENFDKISAYFNQNNIQNEIYPNQYLANIEKQNNFKAEFREEYFSNLFNQSFSSSLIFFDPDNGLQVKNSNDKHLLYYELLNVYNKCDDNSTICVIQFFNRNETKVQTIENRLIEIRSKISQFVNYISDNKICFFLISKNSDKKTLISNTLKKYKTQYKQLEINEICA